MTEEEAKTKWCPQTMSRTPPNPECCAGSVCMAWRVTALTVHEVVDDEQAEPWVAAGWRKAIRAEDGQPVVMMGGDGFCGLAGRPA